ncbi:unnamed protein product [Diplocarpon coronariae]
MSLAKQNILRDNVSKLEIPVLRDDISRILGLDNYAKLKMADKMDF